MQLPIRIKMGHILAFGWVAIIMSHGACSEAPPLRGTTVRPSTYSAAPVAANTAAKQAKKVTTVPANCQTLGLLEDDDEEEGDDDVKAPAVPAATPKPIATAPGATPAATPTTTVETSGEIASGSGGGTADSTTVEPCPVAPVPATPPVGEGAEGTAADSVATTPEGVATPGATPAPGTAPAPATPAPATPAPATPAPKPVVSTPATPPPVAQLDGAALYATNCQSCHRALASSDVKGESAASIKSAIADVGAMRNVKLSDAVLTAIATALR